MNQQFNPVLDAALKLAELRRNLIKKQMDEIPQMSDRQLLKAIYKMLLQQDIYGR